MSEDEYMLVGPLPSSVYSKGARRGNGCLRHFAPTWGADGCGRCGSDLASILLGFVFLAFLLAISCCAGGVTGCFRWRFFVRLHVSKVLILCSVLRSSFSGLARSPAFLDGDAGAGVAFRCSCRQSEVSGDAASLHLNQMKQGQCIPGLYESCCMRL